MAITMRMLPPSNVAFQALTVNGRSYSAAPGTVLDVNLSDSPALEANHWTAIAPSGTTADRPTAKIGLYPALRGVRFYDTTISKLIIYDGVTWRDSAGTSV